MAEYKRFLVENDCPECGHRHLNDHEHVERYKLLETKPEEKYPFDEPQPTSTAEAAAPPVPGASPVGAERGELPRQAAAALAEKRPRGRPRKGAALLPEEAQEKRERLERRAETLVSLELWALEPLLKIEADPKQRTLLVQAWADFADAWGLEMAGKMFSTLMLLGAHGALVAPALKPYLEEWQGKAKAEGEAK